MERRPRNPKQPAAAVHPQPAAEAQPAPEVDEDAYADLWTPPPSPRTMAVIAPLLDGQADAVSVQQANAVAPVQQANAVAPVQEANAVAPVQQANAVAPVQQANAVAPVNQANAARPVRRIVPVPANIVAPALLSPPDAREDDDDAALPDLATPPPAPRPRNAPLGLGRRRPRRHVKLLKPRWAEHDRSRWRLVLPGGGALPLGYEQQIAALGIPLTAQEERYIPLPPDN